MKAQLVKSNSTCPLMTIFACIFDFLTGTLASYSILLFSFEAESEYFTASLLLVVKMSQMFF